MSTYSKACNHASKVAKEKGEWMYVVEEPWEYGGGVGYFPATDEDLETFFYGCSVVMSFGPDGNPEY
jgi:hypothetical protein